MNSVRLVTNSKLRLLSDLAAWPSLFSSSGLAGSVGRSVGRPALFFFFFFFLVLWCDYSIDGWMDGLIESDVDEQEARENKAGTPHPPTHAPISPAHWQFTLSVVNFLRAFFFSLCSITSIMQGNSPWEKQEGRKTKKAIHKNLLPPIQPHFFRFLR
jgi:hypothetical protein